MKRISYIDDFNKWQEEFTFSMSVKVRFSETDMFGHMNNTIPFVYFEQARIELFKHLGFMQDWTSQKHDTIPVVADLQCDFLNQVFFDEELNVLAKVSEIGKTSIDIHYLGIKADKSPVFTGRGRIVQISRVTGKPVPWTEDMIVTMEKSMGKHPAERS